MDAPEAAAAPARSIKAGGRGLAGKLKGHKPAVYIGVAIFGVVLVYYLRKRQAAQDAAPPSPDTTTANPDTATSGYYPSGSTGVASNGGYADPGGYLGYQTPAATDGRFTINDITGLLGALYPNGNQVTYPPVTGGGPAAPVDPGVTHTPPPDPPPPPPAVAFTEPPKPANPCAGTAFPFQGPHGCYKVVCASGSGSHARGRWHFYQNGVEEHVSNTC